MNTKISTQTFVITLAMIFTLTIGSSVIFGQNKADALEGVWESVVTATDCQTGLPDPTVPPFKALLTFMQGGTMSEDNNDPIDGPYRNSSHGIWQRTSGQNYTAVFLHQSFAPDRTFTFTIKVRANITLNPFHSNLLTANSTFEVIDPNGTVVFEGCGKETATRLTF